MGGFSYRKKIPHTDNFYFYKCSNAELKVFSSRAQLPPLHNLTVLHDTCSQSWPLHCWLLYKHIFLTDYGAVGTSSRMNSSTRSQSWCWHRRTVPWAGNGTFTAAGVEEWITLIISPEWIFPKRSITTNMTNIRLWGPGYSSSSALQGKVKPGSDSHGWFTCR